MLLYEGKAKCVYKTEDPEVLRLEYKDEVTAGNGEKQDFMSGKGRLNNLISSDIFKYLKKNGVDSHFIERISDTEQKVMPVRIIPLEVVVRNFAAGSIVRRLGFTNGSSFTPPLVEFYYKEDALHDPILTEDHILKLDIATEAEIETLRTQALKVNKAMNEMMDQMGLKLVDFKIEYGKDKAGNFVLADEISPDTCRIWDKKTGENFDKDVYRNGTGSLIDKYTEFYEKMGAVK